VEARGRKPLREPAKSKVLGALAKVNELIENAKKKAFSRIYAQSVPYGS